MAPAQRSALQTDLIKRLQNREATVCVVGLGYVGLPVAVAIGQAGHQVIGVDMAETRVEQINSGLSYIDDVQTAAVGQLVRSGHLTASVGFEAADVAVIAVPTPLDAGRTPDLTFVRQAARGLAEVMRAGSLVVLESTTYPGTTEEIVVPEFTRKGFTPGQDLFVAYSPERIDPGNKRWTLRNTPKVIGGLNSESLEAAVEFYGGFVDTLVPAPDLKTAEMTKLFENTFRLINIGLVNEFTTICESFGVDIWTVIDACTSKPFGFMPFYPGPGAGGHCIPIDPAYLAWKAREREVSTDFIDLASRINHNMPGRVLERVTHQLNETRLSSQLCQGRCPRRRVQEKLVRRSRVSSDPALGVAPRRRCQGQLPRSSCACAAPRRPRTKVPTADRGLPGWAGLRRCGCGPRRYRLVAGPAPRSGGSRHAGRIQRTRPSWRFRIG
jgi:nucleotide sugar dehydrogenase